MADDKGTCDRQGDSDLHMSKQTGTGECQVLILFGCSSHLQSQLYHRVSLAKEVSSNM